MARMVIEGIDDDLAHAFTAACAALGVTKKAVVTAYMAKVTTSENLPRQVLTGLWKVQNSRERARVEKELGLDLSALRADSE